jgi:hypothetical protein
VTDLEARLAAVARLRVGLAPDGPVDAVRAFYPEDVDGLWSVAAFDPEGAGRVVVLLVADGDVVAHAGLDHAAGHLQSLEVLTRGEWAVDNLRPLLDATGGLTPGYVDVDREQASATDGGGFELSLTAPAEWVRFAASGADGPAPPTTTAMPGGGLAPPKPQGVARGTVDTAYRLRWTYVMPGDLVVGEFTGEPVRPPEAAPDALVAETAIAAARRARRSPLAVVGAPVQRGAAPGTCIVTLLGIGDVEVTVPGS